MRNLLIFIGGGVLLIILSVGVFLMMKKADIPNVQIACTAELEFCSDGSPVGRTGPKCEFAACPKTTKGGGTVKEINVTTAVLNQKILNNGVYITPLEMTGDSRCPVDVTCIWAGTVSLRAKLESGGAMQTVVLMLDSPVPFAGKNVTLVGVTPAPHSKKSITPTDYHFEFLVK